MREVLFRGKTLATESKWVEGFYNHIPRGRFMCDEHCIQTILEDGKIGPLYNVDDNTVGQFTGLTDKNGKKIFEGDIVRDISVYAAHLTAFERGRETKENVERYRYSGKVSVVSFETEDHGSCGCCYHAFSGSGFEAKEVDIRCCEVIGNIHDNPEFLGGSEDDK